MPKAPVTFENSLLIAGLDRVIYSLDSSSGRINWKRKLPAAPSTALGLKDNHIYVGTDDQRIYRLNAEGRLHTLSLLRAPSTFNEVAAIDGGANPFNWPGRALEAADALFRSIGKARPTLFLQYSNRQTRS